MENKDQAARTRYLAEVRLRLEQAGFQTGESTEGCLPVSWQSKPLCRVTGGGGARYHAADVEEHDRNEAFHKLLDVADTTAEYMRLMETASPLKAKGLDGDYRLLADFGGAVLAGHPTVRGAEFVTWEWDYDRTGMWQGHYHGDNYAGAKQDFAVRSGLVQKGRQFSDEQLSEVYRCVRETLDGEYPLTPAREKILTETAEQIETAVPNLEQRVELSNQRELEYAGQYEQGYHME